MTVKQIWDFIRFVVKDNPNRPEISKEEANLALSIVNQDMFFRKYNFLKTQQDDLIELISGDKDLAPFRTSSQLTLTTGEVALPTNYIHYLGAYTVETSNRREIDIISEQELSKRLQVKSSKPISLFPVMTINESKIKVFPTNLTPIRFFYLKKPTAPVYIDILSQTSGLYEYSSGTSTQLEWNEDLHPEFIRNVLNYLGVQVSLDQVNTYIQNDAERR
jgi:hypothetical protein